MYSYVYNNKQIIKNRWRTQEHEYCEGDTNTQI
jgi:hypothetical protein